MELAEREKLKQELRTEVLAELMNKPMQGNDHWNEVKKMIVISYPYPYQSDRIINGISAIVRNVYGIKRINEMTAEQANTTKELLMNMFKAAAATVK